MNTGSAILALEDDPLWQLPLSEVMRTEIVLLLRQGFHLYTVGDFLSAWNDPRCRRFVEQAFDHPGQARQAAATCARWLGFPAPADRGGVSAWWRQEPTALPDPSTPEPARMESQVLPGEV